MKINCVLDNGAYLPVKAHRTDAGFDIKTPVDFTICKGDEVFINTGIHVEIPAGYVGMLKSKSGLNKQYSITTEGVIDSGYTGAIGVKMYMAESNRFTLHKFNKGDKITQLVIMPIPDVEMVEVNSIDDTERGDGGFGSTGR